jgi:hypothetical protein
MTPSATQRTYLDLNEPTWSRSETIARTVFVAALKRELLQVVQETKQRAKQINDPTDRWALERYLTQHRKDIDRKYDFCSSRLPQVRKRMRAKLREIKQQLRQRMHDPVRQTGQWLKSIVQGHFNYYAVPGNLKSLGVFRNLVVALWWRTLRRRSQKRRINWTRTLALATRWLPQPSTLHPFPDARFAATHPR